MKTPGEKLMRQRAGSYRTADARFSLESDGASWFLLDAEHTDELGQPVLTGPFASLALAREALEAARAAPTAARGGPRPTGPKPSKPARRQKAPPPPPPPPETWIDRLAEEDRVRARRAIAALERLGVPSPEAVVRADLRGGQPAIARRIIEQMLGEEVGDEAPAAVRAAVRATLEILTVRGVRSRGDLPRWALVELPDGEPPGRRIVLGE